MVYYIDLTLPEQYCIYSDQSSMSQLYLGLAELNEA